MTSSPDIKPRRKVRIARQYFIAAALFLALILPSLTVIWRLSSDAREAIDKLAVANTDSAQWSLAQIEVEFFAYQNALLLALDGNRDPASVRRRFDVFFSRVKILSSSPLYENVIAIPDIRDAIGRVEEYLDASVPSIDSDDAALQAALLPLFESAVAIQPDIRLISLGGVDVFSEQSDAQRENTQTAIIDLGLIVVALLVVLASVVAVLMYLFWTSRRMNKDIAVAQSRLQAMISTSIDGIVVLDRAGRVLDYNGAAERIFGYSRDEAIGADMAELIIPDELREAHNNGMRRYRETGEKRVAGAGLLKLQARRKDGSVFPVELSINATESADGEIFVSYLRDISRRVANEQELLLARDRAVAGEQAKANLLAVMSHEMRTPLNGVLGTLELLGDTALDERQRKFVEVMETSGKSLLDHVNNVLDISRIDAGKGRADLMAFDLPHLVNGTVESLRQQASERRNSLKVVMLDRIGHDFVGDPARLRQILINLVGNAIKFTEDGVISVEVEKLPDGDLVEFRIVDTGIGIAESDIERIFDDFVTVDASYRRQVEGTGLGLGITRRLIKLLGGDIGVESEPNEGSVFWFRIPLKSAEQPEESVARTSGDDTAAKIMALSVLVVEDNEINRMVAREMLQALNCDVTDARDGQEGVALAAAGAFDLILMDISMPRMDGVTASRKIRESGGPNSDTPIVALTAHALPADITRFRDAGMVDVVTKPLSRDRLAAVLRDTGSLKDGPVSEHGWARRELIATLGSEQAEIVISRVREEIAAGARSLREMASSADAEEISSLAHKLAGSAALAGFDAVHTRLKDVELRSRTMDISELNATLSEIASLLDVE